MMCTMSDATKSSARSNGAGEDPGVLASLPRTRPQRSSPRRIAARRSAQKDGAAAVTVSGGRPAAKPRHASAGAGAAAGSAARKTKAPGTAAGSAARKTKAPGTAAGSAARKTKARGAAAGRAARKITAAGPALPARAGRKAGMARGTDGKRLAGSGKHRLRAAGEPDPVPSQGYECEDDPATGPVQPPGGIELFLSAAEMMGEVAKAGVTTGERLLKDVLSRLPLS
jgi:hypothetical protein